VLVNLGGDIAVAGEPPPGAWAVRVAEDHGAPADAPGQTVALSGGGLATSSTTVRRWHGVHHIIDPATGASSRGAWRTVTVAAASCVAANAAATATIVRGAAGRRWLERLGLPARLVAQGGSVAQVAGWPLARVARAVPVRHPSRATRGPAVLPRAFTARLAGSVAERLSPDGARAALDFPLAMRGPTAGSLHMHLSGRVIPRGGVTLDASRVTLGPPSAPALYRGRIVALAGRHVAALVRGPSGWPLRLHMVLAIDAARRVDGTLSAGVAR